MPKVNSNNYVARKFSNGLVSIVDQSDFMITPDKHHDIVFTFCILAGCMVPMGTCKLINEDSSSSLNSSRYVDEETVTKSALDSLEKYRPCNYDIGPARGEGDDINDICDYYSRLATRQSPSQVMT